MVQQLLFSIASVPSGDAITCVYEVISVCMLGVVGVSESTIVVEGSPVLQAILAEDSCTAVARVESARNRSKSSGRHVVSSSVEGPVVATELRAPVLQVNRVQVGIRDVEFAPA